MINFYQALSEETVYLRYFGVLMQRICRKLGFTLRYDRFEDAMEAQIELRSQC